MSGQTRSGGRGGEWDEGGAGVEGFDGLLIVFMPPPGAGGGSEQSGWARPGAKAKGRERTGASGGGGGAWDVGGAGVEGFDDSLIVFMPPPGVGGGSERPAGHVPERSGGT